MMQFVHPGQRAKDPLRDGLRQIARGRHQSVHGTAIEMIKVDVDDPVPYCLLATIAAEHGNHIKACELFERAALLAPDGAVYQTYFAQSLTTLGHQNRAKAAADRAAQRAIDDAHVADTLGVVYSRTGYHEQAIGMFERAVELDPVPANYHYNLACSLRFLGDFAAAKRAFSATLDRDSKDYRALSSIVGLNKQTQEDNRLDELQGLFSEQSDNADAALHLGHAIAKTLEDTGRWEESFDWLQKAKAGKLAEPTDNRIDLDAIFAAAMASSGSADYPVTGSIAPIFVVGLPRTGTTLVDRILSSHPDVASAGELNFFPGLIKEHANTPSNMVLDGETLAAAENLPMDQIGEEYLQAASGLARGADRFVDKMPLNFFYAGLIHRALPDARIVALRRGAMDSCLSNYRQLLTAEHSYYDYTYSLSDTAAFYRQFDALMSHWRASLPPDRFMEIHYEDIVRDQENQTARLLEFCDLEWNEACMRFHENEAPVSTASSVQVRQPLYSNSIGRWKRYGNKLDELQEALGEFAADESA